jgi:hypothetical protein
VVNLKETINNEKVIESNPTIVSYNYSIVKIYNATNSIPRFKILKLFKI